MKKVLSFVLVLSMILGSFGMAFAAAPADVVGKDYEDAVNALVELGVVAGYKDGSFKPENIVTRAEMATFIVKAMGLADYAVGTADFSDMEGHWANPFVAYAVSLGFVKGNTDGTFAPDATVSYDQAITMLVQALGYKAEYLVGGYPGAFVNQAKALGMLDGVKAGTAGANRGDIATLLFNTLDERFVRYDNEGALDAAYNGGTMRSRLIGAGSWISEEMIVDGDESATINLKEYQGAYVDAYKNNDGDIVAIKEVKSVFLTGKMEDGKFVVDGVKYTTPDAVGYNTNNASAAATFLNGQDITGAAASNAAITNGTVTIAAKVSGKTIKEIYSVAKWSANGEFQWDDAAAKDLKKNNELESADFKLDDNEEIDTDNFVLVGVDALADIEKDDIVTYYVGKGYITKVEVSDATVEGEVTKIKTDGSEATINGKVYDVNKAEVTVALGDEGTFFLNYAGEISAKKAVAEDKDYAVVIKMPGTDGVGYDAETSYKIKLVTENGKEAVFAMTKDAYNVVSRAATTGTVISYALNADGEVKSATTVAMTPATKLSAKGLLDKQIVAKDVVVFTYEIVDGVTEYAIGTMADVPVLEENFTKTTYATNSDNEVAVIVCGDVEAADGIYGVVISALDTKDADDDNVTEVIALVDGVEKTYYVAGHGNTYTATSLYAISVSGDLASFVATESAVGATNGTVAAVAAAGIEFVGYEDQYEDLADDVVVYKWDDKNDVFVVAELDDVEEDDTVKLFELDADDKDGYDLILLTKN